MSFEGVMHITQPIDYARLRLLIGISSSLKASSQARNAQLGRKRIGNRFTLVVAALPAFEPVQRHWNDRLNSQGLEFREGDIGPQLAQRFRQVFPGKVLDAEHG